MYLITKNHFKGITKVAILLRQYSKLGVCHYHNAIRGGGFAKPNGTITHGFTPISVVKLRVGMLQ